MTPYVALCAFILCCMGIGTVLALNYMHDKPFYVRFWTFTLGALLTIWLFVDVAL